MMLSTGEYSPTLADVEHAEALAATESSLFEPRPIELGGRFGCDLKESDAGTLSNPKRSLVLELSNPVKNPFSNQDQQGVFLRFSIGGLTAASWYWVSVQEISDGWVVRDVSRLGLIEQ